MSHRKILGILLGLSILGIVAGFFIVYPEYFGICSDDQNCIDSKFLIFNIAHPLVIGLIPLIPILVILFFFSREVFSTWKKFAIVLIPISIILITITPVYCDAPLNLCLDKKLSTWLYSIGFSILSLIIIIYKSVLILLARQKARRV